MVSLTVRRQTHNRNTYTVVVMARRTSSVPKQSGNMRPDVCVRVLCVICQYDKQSVIKIL